MNYLSKVLGIHLIALLWCSQASADCNQLRNIDLTNPPKKLSATGVFSNLAELKACSEMIDYDVNSPLWSDGAEKKRWMLLPPGGRIQFHPDDPWQFPAGTIFIKHFELDLGTDQLWRLETRLLVQTSDLQWIGYTYQWQDDQKDAVLLDDFATKEFQVKDTSQPSGLRKQTWTFPSRDACLQCHNPWSGYVLGPRTGQINLERKTQGGVKNQLESWNELGLFDTNIGKVEQYSKYANPRDSAETLPKRVKSYLAVNCAQCHQPDSPVRTDIDFRYTTPFSQMNILDVIPNAGDMELQNPYIVKSGSKESSVLWLRLSTSSTLQMPPLGVNLHDKSAIDLIGEWIDSLNPNQTPVQFPVLRN
jgi:uncharacterized repeat protein (TIGR03806 family)